MPSIAQLERLLQTDPHDAFVLYGLAQEYAKAANWETACAYYDRCVRADPHYCYAYFHKARALDAAGKREEARIAVRAGLEAAKASGDAHAASELAGLWESLADE